MHRTIWAFWPLFFGMLAILAGVNLQGTLLGVRAEMAGFSTLVFGALSSLYYIGFLAGSVAAPALLQRVGHIRVFAALASGASAVILLHGMFVYPGAWAVARVLAGLAHAGLLVVTESWLNGAASNTSRGRVLGAYMVVCHVGTVGGQLLLGVGDPATLMPFALSSILVSVALVPISLSTRPAPAVEAPERIRLSRLYILSPLGVVGVFIMGMVGAVFSTLGSVYGAQAGASPGQIALFMAAATAGAAVIQYPLGLLSDYMDRRYVIGGAAGAGAAVALAVWLIPWGEFGWPLYAAAFAMVGLLYPVYALCVAHMNDHLRPEHMLAASASLIFVNGMGACIGPLLAAGAMAAGGPGAFFGVLAVLSGAIALAAVWRLHVREAVAEDDKSAFVALPEAASPMVAQVAQEHILTEAPGAESATQAQAQAQTKAASA